MSEADMVDAMNQALGSMGISDTVETAGQFQPRGTSGAAAAAAAQGLRSVVHQRGAVRVLELIHDDTGSQIELEGSRIPVTHSKDVIQLLTGH